MGREVDLMSGQKTAGNVWYYTRVVKKNPRGNHVNIRRDPQCPKDRFIVRWEEALVTVRI